MIKKFCSILFLLNSFLVAISAQALTATSDINWNTYEFCSQVELDLKSAGFSMPSGRNAAVNKIKQQLPKLVKSPLLNIPVNDSMLLGDVILLDQLTLESITQIIDTSNNHPGIYSGTKDSISIENTIQLKDIAALLIKHNTPYTPHTPIEKVATREYSGIIIDMRGKFPVHGEFVEDTAVPCLFPKIYDDEMNLIYEKNMIDSAIAIKSGIVQYTDSLDESKYQDRIGLQPLRITARELFGTNRTNPIIPRSDALKILSLPENLELLKKGKVVFLMDKEALVYKALVPLKDKPYYFAYKEIKQHLVDLKIDQVDVTDSEKGILISIRNLKFIADTANLLPEESNRLDAIAESLISITTDNENTILVEGHTASIGKPLNEQALSIERAQKIITEMVTRGVPKDLFTYRGYGGTIPIGDNSTPEGRAINRRVEITVIPKATYIQRSND